MLATTNLGKVREFKTLLRQYAHLADLTLLTPGDWPEPLPEAEEVGATFAENAWLKALARTTGTNLQQQQAAARREQCRYRHD